jgi:acyl-CoA thioesterase FadM
MRQKRMISRIALMDRPLERTLVTRGYEMNATGTIPLSGVARYLEHCRWDAMRDSGYGLRAVWGRGVVRAQRIELVAALRFAQEIRIDVCVFRVGRTSVELVHAIALVESGELVGRASATLVKLGPDGRPSPLPPEAQGLVQPGVPPEVRAPPSAVPANAFVREIVVSPSDQDIQQHVNQARYIDFVEDTRAFAARERKLDAEHEAAGQALGRRVCIEYAREATFGEKLSIGLWGIEGEPSAFGAEIRNASAELVARARVETG